MGKIKANLPKKTIRYKELFRFATTLELLFIGFGLIASFIAGAALPFTTLVFGELIDVFGLWTIQPYPGAYITSEQLLSQVSDKTLYFLILSAVTFVATYIYMVIAVYTSEANSFRIRRQYLLAVLRQNIGWFDNVGAGEVATTISTDTLLIQDGIGEKLPLAVAAISTFIAGISIAFYRNWKMTLVLCSVLPFIAISGGITNVIGGRFQTRILALYSKSGNIAEETISSARTVVSFNAQKKLSAFYDASLSLARKEGIKKSIVTGIGLGALFLFLYCAYSLAFWYGHILLLENAITPGTVVNVFFAVLIGAFALGSIAPDIQAFSFAVGAGTKIFETIDRVPDIDPYNEDGIKIPPENFNGLIELTDVEFSYPSRPTIHVLKEISLKIEPGHTVALIGQSGSGKSTIVQLVERFYDPVAGSLKIDGIDIKDLNVASLRQHIGLVSQEPILFEGSIADNVYQGLFGSKYMNETEEKKKSLIEDACKQANAHEFIMKLPKGYDTQVGERGLLLSGGQKQRIAIARAIIKNPKILLLDEATSALDTTSERIVQEALDHVSKSRTTIAIAHRLSTIKNADKIVVMVQGEIVEQGTHEELIKMNQLYTKLVEAQEISHSEQSNLSEKDAITPAEKDKMEINDDKSLQQNVNDVESLSGNQLSSFQILLKIMELNKPELKYTIPGLVASIGSGLIYPFFALVFAEIIEAFSKRGEELKQAATFWSIIFLVIAACSFIFALLQNSLFGFASEHLTERLRSVTFTAILKQDIGFFDQEKNSTGALTSRLSSDAQTVQGVSGSTLGTILQLLTNIVGGILISFIYGWKLAAVATACLPVLLLTGVMRVKILTYFSDMSKDSYSKSSQVACESVAAIRTVQSHGRERDVYNKYSKILEGPYKLGIRSAFLNTQLYAFSQSSNFLVNALVFWYGGYLLAYEGYTIKQFFTVFVAIVFGSQGAGRIFAFAPDMSKAREAAENIIQLIKSRPKIDSDSSSGEIIMNPQGRLVFENVKFSYPTRPEIPILKGLSFEVKPGTFIALVGASGCGKSTVINLVERFYDISEGRILFDGKNIKELNVSKYRYTLGLVSQEPNLFNMTIRQNIIFGLDYNPPDDDIIEAAKEANIHSFIMSLPDKYETSVGAKGSQLSGGQKQRIAIARALIKKPKLLLLDEATSALDAESEKVVQEALDNALRGRTTIAIAHKLSTIQKADVIYVLDEGVVKEQGTSSELFKQKGIYYQLAVQQNLKPQ